MAKGYPSRKRVRKAFERGVKAAKTGRGFNPYKNEVLHKLFERGRNRVGGVGPMRPGATAAPVRPTPAVRPAPVRPTVSIQRPATRQPSPSSSAADPQAAAWDRAVRNSLRRRA
jgi:hypothetical protein